ncbi:HEAT repeat-containing protein 4 [Silurus meridionalis]|uniref:HEAT repeat-containing protein 4 n=1 Tax=Silurus meridionalis TaxID=175797 RepID=UPI001EEA66B6|nr:HEAT repeat-containing protein 4 [Silurus meridionalis]
MDNNSEYQKKLQKRVPCGPEMWTDLPSADMQSVTKAEISRLEKGVQQWVVLPTKANYATEQGLRPPDYTRQEAKVAKEPVHYSPLQRLSSLRYAVEGWKNAWKIKTSRQSVTIEGLMKDLTDLHSQVRVAAIVTCASRAVNRPKLCPHSDETGLAQHGQSYEVEAVPPELQPLLLLALNDPVKRVQLAAAVCQYAIGTPNAQARDILQKALQQDSSGTGVDGWVAAQCLAIEGEASQSVIERLLSQLFLSNAPSDQEQADTLLVSISSKTILVRSLLGEELNCADWKKRVLACKTISELKCPINKDLTNKLLYLMWNDWNGLVRQAAVEALGKMGLGSAIHNELSAKLHEGPTSWRVQALILIGQLKIMTAKLLASFLRCLTDEFVVVRKQACSTAASLMIKDEMIQKNLLHLMQNDSSCEVKVAAINALGRIGWLTPTLQRLLLWAVQNEEDPSVRIVACEALKTLGVKCPELQNLLQERLILETNAQVHRHIEDLMKHYGYSQDTSMFHMITEQVQKLCTKRNITEKLLLLEDLKQQTIENGSHI